MTTHVDLLKGYQQLLALSNRMLEQAQKSEWDELIAHEQTYVRLVENVARDQDTRTLPAQLQFQIRPLLKQVLDNETVLRNLLATRMEELRSLVQTSTQQQKVTSAYGRLSNNVLYPNNI
jgi:flagellar protein FliT